MRQICVPAFIVASCLLAHDMKSTQAGRSVRGEVYCANRQGAIMNTRWAIIVLMGLVAGCACMQKHHHKEEEEGEGKETKMSIDQVPGPVRERLMREAGGAKI